MRRKMGVGLKICVAALVVTFILNLSACMRLPSRSTSASTANKIEAFFSDTPADGVLAFRIEVTGARLLNSEGTDTNLSNGVLDLELRHLELAPVLALQTSEARLGRYSELELTFANPQITTCDSQGNVTVLNESSNPRVYLTAVTETVPVNFMLDSGESLGLMIDFNLLRSIQLKSNGSYLVTPVVSVTAVNTTSNATDAEDADATVLSTSGTDGLIVQFRDTDQQAVVAVNPSSIFTAEGTSQATLAVGQDIEVDARLQSDGNLVADRIDPIACAAPLCFTGVVVGLTQDSHGDTSVEMIALD